LKQKGFQDRNRYPGAYDLPAAKPQVPQKQVEPDKGSYYSEREIIRLLLKYGANEFEKRKEEPEGTEVTVTVADFIVHEIMRDELSFTSKVFGEIYAEYLFHVQQGLFPGDQHFVRHPDPEISGISVDMLADSYELSRIWSEKLSYVESEERMLKEVIPETIIKFKSDKIKEMRAELHAGIVAAAASGDMDEVSRLQKQVSMLNRALKEISGKLGGRIVL
jgi:DNA primase